MEKLKDLTFLSFLISSPKSYIEIQLYSCKLQPNKNFRVLLYRRTRKKKEHKKDIHLLKKIEPLSYERLKNDIICLKDCTFGYLFLSLQFRE